MMDGGTADFGNPLHVTGHPGQFGHVMWCVSTVNGALSAKATVTGTLFWDSSDTGGCGRLVVDFRTSVGSTLERRTIALPDPVAGRDAGRQRLRERQDAHLRFEGVPLTRRAGRAKRPVAAAVDTRVAVG
jgi:hypothetical protein